MCDFRCNRASDNRYFDCPARSYGQFTDHSHPKLRDLKMMELNGLKDNTMYRQFLTNNSSKMIAINRNIASRTNACGPCDAINTYQYIDDTPNKYVPTDMIPPGTVLERNNCMTTADSNRYFPVPSVMNTKDQNIVIKRTTNPSGGIPLSGIDSNYLTHI